MHNTKSCFESFFYLGLFYLIHNSDLLAGTSCVDPSQGSFLTHFFSSDSDRAGNLQAIFILREFVWVYGHDTPVTELRIWIWPAPSLITSSSEAAIVNSPKKDKLNKNFIVTEINI